jgi:hypothetical protein
MLNRAKDTKISNDKEADMRVMRPLCLFLVFAAVIALFIVNDIQNAAAGNKLRVVIMVYSGRADDPSYQLINPKLVSQVKGIIGKASKTKFKGQTIIPSILGYRGIIVENPGGKSGLPEHFAVYNGIIEIMGKEKSYRNDEGRRLESLLLREARREKVIDDKLIRQMNIFVVK